MTLRDQIASDASLVFLSTSDFAETVTYYPHVYFGGSATSRSISAVVFRQQVATVGEDGGEVVLPMYEVHVANSATTGISSEELDTGGDQIQFPPRDGKDAEKKSILHLVTQDNGMLVLQCR